MNNFSDFSAERYLDEYYMVLGIENKTILTFFHELFKTLPAFKSFLEIGSGPVVFQLLSAALTVDSMILSDVSESNRTKLGEFVAGDNQEKYWKKFVTFVLGLEGTEVTEAAVRGRLELVRSKITSIVPIDFLQKSTFQKEEVGQVDVLMINSAIETSVSNEQEFDLGMTNSLSHLKKSGFLIGYFAHKCTRWINAENTYSCFPITKEFITKKFTTYGLELMEVSDVVGADYNQEYQGIFCYLARKK